MSARVAALLVALLLVLGGGAVLYYRQGVSQRPAASGTLGQPLLKNLKAADIAAIAIRAPKDALTLERKGDQWTIAERAGFPADLERVREFVLKAISLRIGQVEPIGAADRARLNLDDSGTRIEFKSADGKALAQLVAGRKYFKSEPDNPDKAPGDGRFVLLPGAESSVYVVSDPLEQASPKAADWIAKKGLEAEKVKSLELKFPGGEGWKIEREKDDAAWKLAGLRSGEKLEITKANAAAYALSIMDLADVAPKDLKPEATGLDKPILAQAATAEGLLYTLKIGKPEGNNYYMTVAISGDSKAEHVQREKMLSEHVLLVPKSRLEDMLKKRSELLERKDAKK
jgi:hypothetical protein